MDKIEIYTNNTCGYCKQLKEKFKESNIKFEEKLTSDFNDEYQDKLLARMLKLLSHILLKIQS